MRRSHHRSPRATHRAAFGFALFASLAALVVAALPASAAAGGHLYLQVGAAIERFPLHGGVPSTQTDLRIPGYGGVFAVAPDGTMYAMRLHPSGGFEASVIYAFAPDQTTPNREIVFPRNGECTLSEPPVQGLAVDATG